MDAAVIFTISPSVTVTAAAASVAPLSRNASPGFTPPEYRAATSFCTRSTRPVALSGCAKVGCRARSWSCCSARPARAGPVAWAVESGQRLLRRGRGCGKKFLPHGGVALAVGPHLQDAQAARRQHRHQFDEMFPVTHQHMRGAVGRAEPGKIRLLRGGKKFLKGWIKPRHRQMLENAAP